MQNGICYGPICTLFDRGFIGVNPETWVVVASKLLDKTAYDWVIGAPFMPPTDQNCRPSAAALLDHIKASEYLSL